MITNKTNVRSALPSTFLYPDFSAVVSEGDSHKVEPPHKTKEPPLKEPTPFRKEPKEPKLCEECSIELFLQQLRNLHHNNPPVQPRVIDMRVPALWRYFPENVNKQSNE